MGFQIDGAAREYFSVPAKQVIPLPEGFKRPLAALIEPLAVAIHAVRRMGEVAGRRFLVLGAGPIGNLVAQAVRALGGEAFITDINPFRLELAAKCDLPHAMKGDDPGLTGRLGKFFGPDGPDGIFECVGVEATIGQAINLARKGTRVIVVGVFGEKPRVDLGLVQDRELELIGTLMYQRIDFTEAIRLVQEQEVRLEDLITHTFRFEDFDKAYRTITEQPERVMKVLIEVSR
jgi:L-iditol 2-dehydrogenase